MPAASHAPAERLRILLAEDDPVSLLFLAEALQDMGFDVARCARGEHALERAHALHFDLLLLDCRMPGFGAEAILEKLAHAPDAASHASPAIASSAQITPELETRLIACGFRAVLHKPLQMKDLEQVLETALPGCLDCRLLDDAAALQSSGNDDTVMALRGLFADELKQLTAHLDEWLDTPATLDDRLHRLRASCGFCGARALARACDQLAGIGTADTQARPHTIERFRHVLHATLGALDDAS